MTNCERCRALLDDYALHASRISEAKWVETHLAECVDCQRELRALQDAWSELPGDLVPWSSPPSSATLFPPSGSLEDRILARAFQLHAEPAPDRVIRRHNFKEVVAKYLVAATILLVLSKLYYSARNGTARVEPEQAVVAQQLHDLAAKLDRLDAMKQVFASPTLRYVSLKTPSSSSQVGAYLVFDQMANEGHFLSFGLPEPRNGEHFVLWLLDREERVVASTSFALNQEKLGGTNIRFPDDPRRVASVRVTVESADVGTEPRTKIPSNTTEYLRAEVRLF